MCAFLNSGSISDKLAEDGARRTGTPAAIDLRSAPHLTDEAIKQTGLFNRFNQVGLDSQLLQFGGTEGVAHGGEHDQARAGKSWVGFDRRRQVKAIHFGHLDIQERDIVRFDLTRGVRNRSRASSPLAALPTCIFQAPT